MATTLVIYLTVKFLAVSRYDDITSWLKSEFANFQETVCANK